jgi:hypothetical protein
MESRSPYRPWRYGFGEAREGDPVAVVLNTDPRTVMTTLGRIGADGQWDRALVDWPLLGPGLVDLESLVMLVDLDPRATWQMRGDAARRLKKALIHADLYRDPYMRFGHSSVAAARILLHSEGQCTGCDSVIDLTKPDATESFRIRTVDAVEREAPEVLVREKRSGDLSYNQASISARSWPLRLPADWPGVLCMSCCARMNADGYTSLIDCRFSQHAKCPRCGVAKTQAVHAGMPISGNVYRDTPPWIEWRGCCDEGDTWTCTVCAHRW